MARSSTQVLAHLGSVLRDGRLRAGLRPEQAAIAADRSVYSVIAYEKGKATPTLGVLLKLCDLYGITLADLEGVPA